MDAETKKKLRELIDKHVKTAVAYELSNYDPDYGADFGIPRRDMNAARRELDEFINSL